MFVPNGNSADEDLLGSAFPEHGVADQVGRAVYTVVEVGRHPFSGGSHCAFGFFMCFPDADRDDRDRVYLDN